MLTFLRWVLYGALGIVLFVPLLVVGVITIAVTESSPNALYWRDEVLHWMEVPFEWLRPKVREASNLTVARIHRDKASR